MARVRTLATRRRWTVLLFMSPWIIGFAAFVAYPMIATLYFSLTYYPLSEPPHWVGLSNYRLALFGDPFFWGAVGNTVWMVCLAIPAKIAFALGVSLFLARVRRGASVYRSLVYLPAMVPVVAASLSFLYLLNTEGPVNKLLRALGVPGPSWFSDPIWAKPGLTLIMIWGAGNTMVILLAALLDVPRELYEAAELDGASAFTKFSHVTLPMISPVLYFTLLTGIIDGFQYFTQAYVTARTISPDGILGAPENSTMFYGTWLYQQGYSYFNMGYASALAWLLFLAVFAVTVVIIRRSRGWVHYSGS